MHGLYISHPYVTIERPSSATHVCAAAQAKICLVCLQLVQGAEAKALYGLVLNYKALQALVERLVQDSTLTGDQVSEILQGAGLRYFPDPYVEGFTWGPDGGLVYPGMQDEVRHA